MCNAIRKIGERQALIDTSFKELLNALHNRYAKESQSTEFDESLPPQSKRPRRQDSACDKQPMKYSEDILFADDAWHG